MGPYRAISTQIAPIFMIFDETPSMIFSNFDARMASIGPGTYLERSGSKFCVEWWSGYLHSSHMDPIGEKPMPWMDLRYPGPGTRTTDHGPGTRDHRPGPGTTERDQGPGPWTRDRDWDQGPRTGTGTRDHGPEFTRKAELAKVAYPHI